MYPTSLINDIVTKTDEGFHGRHHELANLQQLNRGEL